MENNNGKEEAEDNRKIRQRDTGKGKKTNDKTRQFLVKLKNDLMMKKEFEDTKTKQGRKKGRGKKKNKMK